MTYVLDTNILVSLLRYKNPPNTELFNQGAAISIITYAELLVGAQKSLHPTKNLQLIQSMLQDLDIATLPLTEGIAQVYANLRVSLEKKGRRIEDLDLLIAATAISHHLTLVTANIKHFSFLPNLKFKTNID